MDDTTVKLLQKGKGKGRNKPKTARLWVYARDEKPWGSTSAPAAWYQFSTSREAQHPSQHLQTYKGFAHADAYAGYNDVYRTGRVTEMACMVHIRRPPTLADFGARGLVCCSLALDFDDWRLKTQRVHVGNDVHTAITALGGDARGVAHALQKMRHKVLKLVTCELCHKAFDYKVAGVGLLLPNLLNPPSPRPIMSSAFAPEPEKCWRCTDKPVKPASGSNRLRPQCWRG